MEKSPLEIAGKPDKAVTCPRCGSSNTKFCYYNNHNVNQPRYFCKGCQRYWTDGGSLRNVPVGAGKRKYRSFPPANPAMVNNPPDIFCFTGSDLHQGLFPSSVDSSSVLSFKQPVSCSSNLAEPQTVVAPPLIEESEHKKGPALTRVACSYGDNKLSETQTFVFMPHASCSHVEIKPHPAVCKEPSESVGFLDTTKKSATIPAVDSKLPKEAQATSRVNPLAHLNKSPLEKSPLQSNVTHDLAASPHIVKQDLRQQSQHPAEADESVCCSSVTANLRTSEALSESNGTPTLQFAGLPTGQPLGLGGAAAAAAAWGPSMWPWVWPYMFNGSNSIPSATMPQVGLPQVAPSFATALATGGIPPVHPAFAAALSAMAAGPMPQVGLPQVDPSFTASLAASVLQFPQLWNPFSWGLPWSAAWNMANASASVPYCANTGTMKRPRSPAPEQGCGMKTVKMDEVAQSASLGTVGVSYASNFPAPSGFLDAFQPKTDVSQVKPMPPPEAEEHSDLHQAQVSHPNPAAQARSATFQEGSR